MKRFYQSFWSVALCAVFFCLAACPDDDSPEAKPVQVEATDGRAYVQQSLVVLDEAGRFKHRALGEPLNSADTTLLYVCVWRGESRGGEIHLPQTFPRDTAVKEGGTSAGLLLQIRTARCRAR